MRVLKWAASIIASLLVLSVALSAFMFSMFIVFAIKIIVLVVAAVAFIGILIHQWIDSLSSRKK